MHVARTQTRLPKYRRAPERFGRFEPTARDLRILKLVHDYRYLTAEQITALLAPGSPRQIARRLQGLFHHGFLSRLLPPLRIRVADDNRPNGSPRVTYALDREGARSLSEAHGVPDDSIRWTPAADRRMHWFLEHRVMISSFRATLELALVNITQAQQFLEWRDEDELRDGVTVRYPDGLERQHRVAPDGYFAVQDGPERRNFFLEIDRGTEEHPRLLGKFLAYWWYFSTGSGYHTRYENAKNCLVLVVTTSEARLQGMRKTLARVDPKGRGLRQFWFTTVSQYTPTEPAGILRPIWRVGPAPESATVDPARSLFGNEKGPR